MLQCCNTRENKIIFSFSQIHLKKNKTEIKTIFRYMIFKHKFYYIIVVTVTYIEPITHSSVS